MAAKVLSSATLSGTCGVGLFYNMESSSYWGDPLPRNHAPPRGGCGWNIAGYIKGRDEKEVYDSLKKKYKIVQQSEVRRNRNSGNDFFYVMYDCKKPRKSKENPNPVYDLSGNDQYNWPWK